LFHPACDLFAFPLSRISAKVIFCGRTSAAYDFRRLFGLGE